MNRSEILDGLPPAARAALRKTLDAHRGAAEILFTAVERVLSPARLPALQALLSQRGFQLFLARRSGRSRERLESLLAALFARLESGIDVRVVAETAARMTRAEFTGTERSFFVLPVDEAGCLLFQSGFIRVAEQNPRLIPELASLCASDDLVILRRRFRGAEDAYGGLFDRLVDLLLAERSAGPALKAARHLGEGRLDVLVKEARAAGDLPGFLARLFRVFQDHPSPSTFAGMLEWMVKRYGLRAGLSYRRTLEAWPVLADLPAGEERTFRAFLDRFGNTRDEIQVFVWELTFGLKDRGRAGKALRLFASDPFQTVLRRFGGETKVLKLLLKNVAVALLETGIEDLNLSLYPMILKLLLTLSIERTFMKRRADYFDWMRGRTGSQRLELEVIRMILFEYIFLASGAVPVTRPQKMTRFCDRDHAFFCRQIDVEYADMFRMRGSGQESAFLPVLKRLRERMWQPVRERFPDSPHMVEELASMAASVDVEDAVLDALETVEPQDLSRYHECFTDAFRRRPEAILEAAPADVWYRIGLERALPHVHGIMVPLVGMVSVVPDSEGNAATDGRHILLPAHVGFFKDPLEPLQENRNLTVYVGLALHEAGHILAGTFSFDMRTYMAKLEDPELFRFIFNVFEDFRIEEFLVRVGAHPQAEEILTNLNVYYSARMLERETMPAFDVFLRIMDDAGGRMGGLEADPRYQARTAELHGLRWNTGRFPDMRALISCGAERLRHIDVANPLAAVALAREFYGISRQWPDEFLQNLGAPQNGLKARNGTGTGRDIPQPITEEDFQALMAEYRKDPEGFLERMNLPALKGLVRPQNAPGAAQDAPGAAQDVPPTDMPAPASGQSAPPDPMESRIKQLTDMLLTPLERPDYTSHGTIDFSRRSVADEEGADRQVVKRKPRARAAVRAAESGPRKRKFVYSIDPNTRSRTHIGEVREFTVRRVDMDFLRRMRRWDYIAHRVYAHLARLVPSLEEERVLSSQDGDLDMDALIGILSDRRSVGVFEYLESVRESRRDIEVIIGLDASGSTMGHIDGDATILDVEKAFALILASALRGLTDRIALLAFNSATSTNVYRAEPLEAVSSITSDQANRDGDFLRYVKGEMEASAGRSRYFFLLSDGMPCSDNYTGKEALDDTVIAMREVVQAGIRLVYLNIDCSQAEYFPAFRKEASYAEHFRRPEDILPRIPELVKAMLESSL